MQICLGSVQLFPVIFLGSGKACGAAKFTVILEVLSRSPVTFLSQAVAVPVCVSRAVKGSCSVGALPGDAGIGRAGNSGGERRRLGDNEKKWRSGRALGKDGNGDDVSDFAAAATAGQRENGQECRC